MKREMVFGALVLSVALCSQGFAETLLGGCGCAHVRACPMCTVRKSLPRALRPSVWRVRNMLPPVRSVPWSEGPVCLPPLW